MDPLVGGSLISGGLSAIGGLFTGDKSVKAQKLANESNERIAREANQWNRENMIMQNNWNIEQWNRENEYNSASAQVQRYREAGLNPFLAMTGGASAGTASSLTSADSSPASEVGRQMPIDYSAYNNVFQTLRDLPSQISNAELNGSAVDKNNEEARVASETANQLGIENFYKSRMLRLTVQKMIQDLDVGDATKRNLLADLDAKERENSFFGDYEVNNARKQQYVQGARLLAANAAMKELDKLLGDKSYKWFDKMQRANFARIIAEAKAASAAAGLSKQQEKMVFEQTALSAFDNKVRKQIGMKGIRQLANDLVNSTHYDIEKNRVMSENLGDLWDSEIFRNYAGAAGEAVGGFFNVFGGSETTNMDWNDFGNQTKPDPSGGKTHRGYVRRKTTSTKRFKFKLPKFK